VESQLSAVIGYDNQGRVTSESYPLNNGVYEYDFDPSGRIARMKRMLSNGTYADVVKDLVYGARRQSDGQALRGPFAGMTVPAFQQLVIIHEFMH
jgi:YD repeat-containing protein